MTLRDRINKIIDLKSNGNTTHFAKLTGWSCETVRNVRRAGTNNVTLITDLLRAVPEISARWLLLGEGEMLRPFGLAYAEGEFLKRLARLADIATLVSRMDAAQLRRFQVAVAQGNFPDFTPDEIAALKDKR